VVNARPAEPAEESPTGLDRLDPPPRPPRPPRPRIGPEERGVRHDLKLLNQLAAADQGALAAQALVTAREIDSGELVGRDRISARAQVRQCIVTLREQNPGGDTGDATDAARAGVEAVRGLYAVPEN
jgi:hypothetical protein